MSHELESRISQAEAIIRALGRLVEAMYESDLEANWPIEASELVHTYEDTHGVDLEYPFS